MELTENAAITDNSRSLKQSPGIFTPEDVLRDFMNDYLDVKKCREWILKRLQPYSATCPKCWMELTGQALQSFWSGKRICCGRCGKYFSALTGTFLSGCHLKFTEIVLLAFLIALGVADKQIAGILKMSAENVRLWKHRFEAIAQAKQIAPGEIDGN